MSSSLLKLADPGEGVATKFLEVTKPHFFQQNPQPRPRVADEPSGVRQDQARGQAGKQKATPAVAGGTPATLQPRITQMDARGRPVGASEECRRPEAAVQVIQHKDWLQAVAQESKRDFLKAVFRTAVHEFQGMFAVFEQPIVIVRKESKVYVKATRNVPEKQIVIPLFFRKLTSVYHYEEVAAHVTLTAVDAELTWALTEKERSAGMEEE